jgi:hypothetical protein
LYWFLFDFLIILQNSGSPLFYMLATFVLVSCGFLSILQNSGLPLCYMLATCVLGSFEFSDHSRLAAILYFGSLSQLGQAILNLCERRYQ